MLKIEINDETVTTKINGDMETCVCDIVKAIVSVRDSIRHQGGEEDADLFEELITDVINDGAMWDMTAETHLYVEPLEGEQE